MPTVTAEGSSSVPARESSSRLLQLPEAALAAVLQKLDSCSLANTALSCTAHSHAVPNSIRTIAASCKSQGTLGSFMSWLAQHSLIHVIQCSAERDMGYDHYFWIPAKFLEEDAVLQLLPCPQLRQLRLHNLKLQLQPAAGFPGVLQHCTGLTALQLKRCLIFDAHAAAAAIAALSRPQDLRLVETMDPQNRYPFAAAQLPTSLTQLKLYTTTPEDLQDDEHHEQLTQLSALVNLQHLELSELSHNGVPGGLPSQLVKLTCLHINFWSDGDTAEQFRHLSALTALRELSISFVNNSASKIPEDNLSGISHLARLTSLQLQASQLYVGTETTTTWARLTALHSLTLINCRMQPSALASLAQLQLSLWGVLLSDNGTSHDLLMALSHLTVLTELHCHVKCRTHHEEQPPAPAAAFTALTASTHLRSLQVDFGKMSRPADVELFPDHAVYPHLREIHVDQLAPSQQLMQRLISSCPAVESLAFMLRAPCAPTECLPLVQLTALTHLWVKIRGSPEDLALGWPAAILASAPEVADTATSLLDVAAQLTGLKCLGVNCECLPSPFDVPQQAVRQLTALTALEDLSLDSVRFENKARCGKPPDVWSQLLRHCRRQVAS